MAEEFGTLEMSDARLGTLVQGRYRIVRRLGEGGMGVVYEAEHVLIGRRVALKSLHSHFAENKQIVARFHQEARASTSVGNEHIVEVTDMGRFDDGALFLVLEYLEGKDFGRQIAEQGPQSIGRVVHILEQLCDALAAVHAKGIVHRDLKPDNLFLVQRGAEPDFVKILDFGISKIKESADQRLTTTGATLGTPHFMAPEQAHADPDIDHRADIYALGGIMFYALTGEYPFSAPTIPSLLVQICTARVPDPTSIRADLPPALAAIIVRALAKDKNARFLSVHELKMVLLEFRANHPHLCANVNPVPPVAGAARAQQSPSLGTDPTVGIGAHSYADAERAAAAAAAAVPPDTAPAMASDTQPSRRRRRRGAYVAVAALASVSLGVVLWVKRETSAPTAEERGAGVAGADDSSEALAPEMVELTIAVEPAAARVFVNGAAAEDQGLVTWPRGDAAVVLEARLAGYETQRREVVPQRSQRVAFSLERNPEPAPPASTSPPSEGGGLSHSASAHENRSPTPPPSPPGPRLTATPAEPARPAPVKSGPRATRPSGTSEPPPDKPKPPPPAAPAPAASAPPPPSKPAIALPPQRAPKSPFD